MLAPHQEGAPGPSAALPPSHHSDLILSQEGARGPSRGAVKGRLRERRVFSPFRLPLGKGAGGPHNTCHRIPPGALPPDRNHSPRGCQGLRPGGEPVRKREERTADFETQTEKVQLLQRERQWSPGMGGGRGGRGGGGTGQGGRGARAPRCSHRMKMFWGRRGSAVR